MPHQRKKEVIVLKKSIRILSLVMSIVMLSGIFSVFASAAKYTGDSIVMYDDLDKPVYTSDQYATMLVDYLDNMLAEMDLVLTDEDIFVGTLDVRSINSAFAGVKSLWASVDSLKSVVGDIGNLDISVLTSLSRDDTVDNRDKKILYNVLDFLAGNAWVFSHYAEHTLNVGAIQSLVANYMFYIKDLVVGLLYGLIDDDYDYFDDFALPEDFKDSATGHSTDTAVADLLTVVVENVLLGEWTKLNPIIDDSTNKVTADMYDFAIPYETSKGSYDFYGWVLFKEKNGEKIVDDEWVCSSLGGTAYVSKGSAAPGKVNEYLDFTNPTMMYPMLEQLLVRAYNHILVPWLNRQIINWVREECDIVDYNENTPDLEDKLDAVREKNDLAKIINIDELVKSTYTARNLVPTSAAYAEAGGYLLNNLNNILGDLINGTTTVTENGVSAVPLVAPTYTIEVLDEESQVSASYTASWTWKNGDNSLILPNICSLGRFILAIAGKDLINGCGGPELFFDPDGGTSEDKIESDDELVGYLLRIILNDSIDFCNIPEDCLSLKEIAFTLVQQWAWVENPQVEYDDYDKYAAIDQILKMLVDIAAKALNQEMDTVYTISDDDSGIDEKNKKGLDYYNKGSESWTYFDEPYDPVENNGLLPVDGETAYGDIVVMLACWGVSTYGSILDGILELNSNTTNPANLDIEGVWQDLDTILNSLIPIKYNGLHFNNRNDSPWIGDDPISDATDSEKSVIETVVFDYILGALLDFDISKLLSILDYNPGGALAKNSIEKVIVDLVHRLFDLLFPDVFNNTVSSLDGFLDEENVPAFLYDLIECLGTTSRKNYKDSSDINGRGTYILELAFPIVASILELDGEQEFGELENYIPDQIVPEKGEYTFTLYNASQGVNTSYRKMNDEGEYQRYQDSLYKYVIQTFSVVNLNGSSTPVCTQAQGKTLFGGESLKIKLSNLNDGMILKVITTYKVYDENGQPFKNGDADRVLTNTKYSYVGSAKDDDSVYGGAVPTSGENGILQYPVSRYVNASSNLTDINGYSVRINNRKYSDAEKTSGKDIVAKVTSVSGSAVTAGMVVANLSELHMTSSNGTYSFSPVKAAEGVTRADFADGKYGVNVTMNVEGATVNFSFDIVLYNDYGLVSLTNRAIDKNYSSSDVKDSSKWTAYNTALEAAAKVALAPRAKATYLSTMANAETLVSNLSNASANLLLPGVLSSASAKDVWDAVNSVGAYDYTLEQVNDSNGTPIESVFFKSEIAPYDQIATSQSDIDDGGAFCDYISANDYAPGSYAKFRSAKNEANDLASKGMKVIDASWVDADSGNLLDVEDIKATVAVPEDYDTNEGAAKAYDDQMAAIEATYDSIVNYEAPIVSNVQAAYAISKLELTYSRLIPVTACTDVLSNLASEYDVDTNDYTLASAEELARELEFAKVLVKYNDAGNTIDRTIGNTTLTENVTKPSMVKKATEKLIKAYKNLETAANTSDLNDMYDIATAFFDEGYTGDPSGYEFAFTELTELDPTDDAWVYNYFKAFLDAYNAAGQYYTGDYSEDPEAEFPASKQKDIDDRTENLSDTLEALKSAIDNYEESGDVPEPTATLLDDQEWSTDVYEVEYVPAIDSELLTDNDFEFTATYKGKGYEVTDILIGIYPSELESAFDVENGEVVVQKPEGALMESSGSIVVILDNEGNVSKVYLAVYAGDNNGDGDINAKDARNAIDYTFFKMDWDDTNDGAWKYIASDVNGDTNIDANDYNAIIQRAFFNRDINQNPIGILKPEN